MIGIMADMAPLVATQYISNVNNAQAAEQVNHASNTQAPRVCLLLTDSCSVPT